MISVKGHNNFEHVLWRDGSMNGTKLRALCSDRKAPDCSYDGEVKLKGPTCEQDSAERLFRGKGWDIGKDRAHDICPVCVKFERDRRREARLAQKAEEEKAAPPKNILPVVTPTPPASPSPLVMGDGTIKAPTVKSNSVGVALTQSNRAYADLRKAVDLQFVLDFMASHAERRPTGAIKLKPGWTDARLFDELSPLYPWLKNKAMVTDLRQVYFGFSSQHADAEKARRKTVAAQVTTIPTPPPHVVYEEPMPNKTVTANIADINNYTTQRDPEPPKQPGGAAALILARLKKIEERLEMQDKLMLAMKERVQELSDEVDDVVEKLDAFFKDLEG